MLIITFKVMNEPHIDYLEFDSKKVIKEQFIGRYLKSEDPYVDYILYYSAKLFYEYNDPLTSRYIDFKMELPMCISSKGIVVVPDEKSKRLTYLMKLEFDVEDKETSTFI